jgi:hypothetical protein
MKKAILSIGLFTLVLASTSFASPKSSTPAIADAIITPIDGNGGQSTGDNKKLDYNGGTAQISFIDGNGGQSTGDNKKID